MKQPTNARRMKAKARAAAQAMQALCDEAKAQGCERPVIYVEDGDHVHVMDAADPHWGNAGSDQQRAIFYRSPFPMPPGSDCGAW